MHFSGDSDTLMRKETVMTGADLLLTGRFSSVDWIGCGSWPGTLLTR